MIIVSNFQLGLCKMFQITVKWFQLFELLFFNDTHREKLQKQFKTKLSKKKSGVPLFS